MFRRPGRGWPSATGRRVNRPRRWRPSAAARSAAWRLQQELSTPADGHALVAAAVAPLGGWTCWWRITASGRRRTCRFPRWPRSSGGGPWRVNLDSVFGLVQAAVAQMDRQEPVAQPRPRGPHRADQLHSRAARRGQPRRLCRDQRRADQSYQEPVERAGAQGDPGELRGAGVGGDGYVGGRGGRPRDGREDQGGHSPWAASASPREIAGPVLFLCTPLAGFISGEVLNVNGGSVLGGDFDVSSCEWRFS